MAGLDEQKFDLFGYFELEFFKDELLTGTGHLTEQTKFAETGSGATITEQAEQTEGGQLNDEDIDNFVAEKQKAQPKRRKVTLTSFTNGQKLSTKRELLKTYQNKNWTKF